MGVAGGALAAAGTAASLVGTAVSAAGAISQSQANSSAAKYSAAVAQNNATIASYNAQAAEDTQAAKTQSIVRAGDQKLGAQRAALGASGVTLNSGSALDVQTATVENTNIDAQSSDYQGKLTAYGYRTQEQNYTDQATLDSSTASNDITAGYFSSGSTLLSGAGQVASRWYQTNPPNTTGMGGTNGYMMGSLY